MSPRKHIPEGAVSVELEVPFHDVDALRLVWHGHYLKYLEVARTQLMRSFDLDVAEIVQLGYRMVVIESRIRHTFPLHYGDRLRASAWIGDCDSRIRIRYVVWNLTHDRRAAHGDTDLATTRPDGSLLLGTPEVIRGRLVQGI